MPKYRSQAADAPTEGLDEVLKALADPTRRAVVERLTTGPVSTTDLAAGFPMALPSFVQHLDVLERCGVVASSKVGRVRTYVLRPASLRRVDRWLDRQRARWETRLDQLDALLTDQKAMP